MKEKHLSEIKGKIKIITTEKVIYQLSTFEYQNNNEEPNISSINL